MSIDNRDLLATCWTWAGDAAPARGNERSPIPMEQRLKAISAAGWEGIGLVHADLAEVQATIGLSVFRSMLAEHGVRHVELEFLSNWWAIGEPRRRADRVRHELFDAAQHLGVTTIKAGAELKAFDAPDQVTYDHFAAAFDALATEAGSHGLRIALEPMPMSNLPSIAAGAAFVTDVGNRYGGLCIDTYHVHRSQTSYSDLVDILPRDHVFVDELTDAHADVVGDLWEDATNHRLIPGEGSIDVAGFVAEMHRFGWRNHWGVEIISDEHRRRPLTEALTLTRKATLDTLEVASVP